MNSLKRVNKTDLYLELKKNFGFNSFKGHQEEIILNLLEEKDSIVIMPTGGGKSMCYQLPALISSGTAIVISPLIALMKNQVDLLRGFSKSDNIAHVLNSSLSKTEAENVKNDLYSKKTKLLYVAPESLTKDSIIDFLKRIEISFYAIDEAHCISEWGHDFRPEYRKLRQIFEKIKIAPIIALTATATPKVRNDIKKNLKIENAKLFIDSFNRNNLFYEIKPKVEPAKQIIKFIKERDGQSGIVYCLSRKKVEQIAEILIVNGIKALPYHAGLESKVRMQNQDAFLMEECDVIVATIAFGMGIDKPDIRFVVHHDIPKSLEGYYQETGRAGRDGGKGDCLTLYDYKDIEKLEKFLQSKPISEQELGKLMIMETIAFSETSLCRRKYLLHYFGEDFDENKCNNMCDNCKNPKPKIDGKRFIVDLLRCIVACNESFKSKEIAKIMVGESNSLINQYRDIVSKISGIGKEKSIQFWHSVLRQIYVKGLINKEIESYGTIKLTKVGKDFIENPVSFEITEDHDYNKLSSQAINTVQKGESLDKNLFLLLKDLRKKEAIRISLPPSIIFSEPSLIEMSNMYPITIEEISNISGVGNGKATKYGIPFIKLIDEYVKENNIERPNEMIVKSVANKGNNKIHIIQSLDKKLNLEDIARGIGLDISELIDEIESIVESGTKLNLHHIISDFINEEDLAEIIDFFKESENFSFDEAREEFEEDEFSDNEIKLLRIEFISSVGN